LESEITEIRSPLATCEFLDRQTDRRTDGINQPQADRRDRIVGVHDRQFPETLETDRQKTTLKFCIAWPWNGIAIGTGDTLIGCFIPRFFFLGARWLPNGLTFNRTFPCTRSEVKQV